MSKAFVSQNGCMSRDWFGNPIVSEPGRLAKMSTIWFDKVIFQTWESDHIKRILDCYTKRNVLTTDIADCLSKIWLPLQDTQGNYIGIRDLLQSYSNTELESEALKITWEATKKQFPQSEGSNGFLHEIGWATYGLISGIVNWQRLNNAEGPCTFIPHEREQKIQSALMNHTNTHSFRKFRNLTEQKIPDFNNLSWDKVIELRNHKFCGHFREKITFLSQRVHENKKDDKSIGEIVEEMYEFDLPEIFKLIPSSPKKAFLKTIVTGIPIPLFSLFFGGVDIYEEYRNAKKYGWLQFWFDFQKISRQ